MERSSETKKLSFEILNGNESSTGKGPVKLEFMDHGDTLHLHLNVPHFRNKESGDSVVTDDAENFCVNLILKNNENQYLKIDLYMNKYLVTLQQGNKTLRHSLPLKRKTIVSQEEWMSMVDIPWNYLPPNVNKINAHSMLNGEILSSLYPGDSSSPVEKLTALTFFGNINLNSIKENYAKLPLSQFWKDSMDGKMKYKITKSWNGKDINHEPVSISFKAKEDCLHLHIEAPFFNDPPPKGTQPGHPLWKLWEFEVVEVFLLNENHEYLEVEVGPHGQHLVLFLDGKRNILRHSLPMDVSTTISGNHWTGMVDIPWEYIPANVTTFNAYAVHILGDDRHYESLFPADSLKEPEFHALEFFRPIDLDALYEPYKNANQSTLWTEALNGSFIFALEDIFTNIIVQENPCLTNQFVTILNPPGIPAILDHQQAANLTIFLSVYRHELACTFGGSLIDVPKRGYVLLKREHDGVTVEIFSLFHNDSLVPSATTTEPYPELWKHEAMSLYFMNENMDYLALYFGARGHYYSFRNYKTSSENNNQKLTFSADITDVKENQWRGTARIPFDLFPPSVSRMNVFYSHGKGHTRHYEAMSSSVGEDKEYPQPFYPRLDLFEKLDYDFTSKLLPVAPVETTNNNQNNHHHHCDNNQGAKSNGICGALPTPLVMVLGIGIGIVLMNYLRK